MHHSWEEIKAARKFDDTHPFYRQMRDTIRKVQDVYTPLELLSEALNGLDDSEINVADVFVTIGNINVDIELVKDGGLWKVKMCPEL